MEAAFDFGRLLPGRLRVGDPGGDLFGMVSPAGGRAPRSPWETTGGSGLSGSWGRIAPVLGSLLQMSTDEIESAVLDATGSPRPGDLDPHAPIGRDSMHAADRGPDDVSDMPGGAEVLLRQRRARRVELLKEGFNVGVGVLGVFLVAGLALIGWGVDPVVAAASAGAGAVGYGYVLGREVLADLSGVRERERRDADWG